MKQKPELGFVKFDYDDPEHMKAAVDAMHSFLMGQIATR